MVTQISVFLENKDGNLARILHIFEEAHIDIRALSLADSIDFGMLRMIVSDAGAAREALERAGCLSTLTSVVGAIVPDEVGGLTALLDILSGAGVSIEYMYSYLTANADGAHMILRVADPAPVESLLVEKGYTLIS